MKNEQLKITHLIDLAGVLGKQTNFQEILRLVTQQVSDWFDADITLIMMLNPLTGQTVKTIYKEEQSSGHSRYKSINNQICGWLIKYRQPLYTADIKKDDRFRNSDWKNITIKSVLGVPMYAENNLIGTLILINKDNPTFNNNDVDFLEKISVIIAPYLRNIQELQQYFNAPLSGETLAAKYKAVGLFGKSSLFNDLLQAVEAAAQCDVRVLLEGQSGTGKELIARAIHTFSNRSDKPFIAIDCGAIPGHLVESELFGHIKGAFTGANRDRKGLFVQANQGTLFLDEIANLPLDIQSKLLRVLQESELRPVGSDLAQKINVRIVAASSISLKKMVVDKKFREDLYYRLHVYPVIVPSLNERPEDIPLIANYFLDKFSKQQKKNIKYFHENIVAFMRRRTWKGNIRELINFVERLVTLCTADSKRIDPVVIPADLKSDYERLMKHQNSTVTKPLKDQLFDNEKEIIQKTLIAYNWNQTKAAESLHLTEQLIRYRMKKLGIKRPG